MTNRHIRDFKNIPAAKNFLQWDLIITLQFSVKTLCDSTIACKSETFRMAETLMHLTEITSS